MRNLFRRGSIYRQRLIVALILMAIAVGVWLAIPNTFNINWIVASFFMVLALQFAYDIYCQPLPMDAPWAVKAFEWLQRKWEDFSQPAVVGEFEGKPVLERWHFFDFRTVYDGDGRAIATEQTINWSDSDMDWRPGMPEDKEVIITPVTTGERLSWLARWRSPKLA